MEEVGVTKERMLEYSNTFSNLVTITHLEVILLL